MGWRTTVVALGLLLVAGCSSERKPGKAGPPSGGSPFETFTATTPKAGEVAPGFDLGDTDGAKVRLSDATARGPVVLVFGSFT